MDVCPFIPIKNITIDDCVELSKAFAQLLSEELDIPVYLYAESQPLKYRSELSDIRQGTVGYSGRRTASRFMLTMCVSSRRVREAERETD